ncbi:MAG: hypothetical protein AABY53_05705 [Bdellovibrionota bacterium]
MDKEEVEELKKTKIEVVNDLPVEYNMQEVAITALIATAVGNGVHQYTFLIKKEVCDAQAEIDLEALVRLRVAEHYALFYSDTNERVQQTAKNNWGTIKEARTKEELYKQYLAEKLKFDPKAAEVKEKIQRWADKKNAQLIKSGVIKLNSVEPAPQVVQENLIKQLKLGASQRIQESVRSANVSTAYGSFWQNPDVRDIYAGQNVQANAVVDTLSLLIGRNNLPNFLKDRVLLETFTDITNFDNYDQSVSQITAIKLKLGDLYLSAKRTDMDFANEDSNNQNCFGNTHCQKHEYNSYVLRWNLRDPLKYRSNVYFEYDLIKLNAKEANVVKTVSQNNPHWPLLRRLNSPTGNDPGLLLGYIVRAGFTAQIADKVPQFLPFLKQTYGKLEIYSEARINGSTIGTDDGDSLDLEFGFQIRYPNYYIVGFKTIYSAEIHGEDSNFLRSPDRSVVTGMVYITIPIDEPDYLDEEFQDKKYSKKFKVTSVKSVNRFYSGEVPEHFNTDETMQKATETGIQVASTWGRFIYELMLSRTHGKKTALSSDTSEYVTGRLGLKYELNSKLRLVLEGQADNYKKGNGEIGVGIEIKPLAGTDAEKNTDISIKALYHPFTTYPAVARSNQFDKLAPGLDIDRDWSLTLDAKRSVNIPFLTTWTNIQAEFGLNSRMYMKDFDYGYYSVAISTGLVHKDLGISLGFNPYLQDFNFGAASGFSPFAAAGRGQTGPHADRYFYFEVDVLKASYFIHNLFYPNKDVPVENAKAAVDGATAIVNNAADEKKPLVDLKNLPTPDRDQTKVMDQLAMTAKIWLSGDQSAEALELYKAVPHLVSNIAKKQMFLAKMSFEKDKFKHALEVLEDVYRLYHPDQDYEKLFFTGNENLEALIRNTYSKDAKWKEHIQSVARSLFEEVKFCLGVTHDKLGNDAEAKKYLANTSYKLPWIGERQYQATLNNTRYCVP